MEGKVDVLVAGVGTGGTLSGTGRYLKEKNPALQVIAVEPDRSPVLTEGRSGSHGLMGIGANFVPDTLDRTLIDEIIRVKEEDAYAVGRRLPTLEGFLIGISGGAALHAATELAKRPAMAGKNIVVIFPDSGERYLSTPLYQ
ncbi:cysteine synthase A [gut metagenome]|uniref:Cysteine synthase A n=1 Tax=gut metagenome TaxID=749906 RepID=J9G607_9ZZZZ